ncbi:MAG: HEAT repeat domain-containing protein [Actinobacteria bacterium]|nr:HEAT repeat domain-containing protein [Actinomycetota bacterium]
MAERHLHGAPPPDSEVAKRRRTAIAAGHSGDHATAIRLCADPEPVVRAAALGALARFGVLTDSALGHALADTAPEVRRRALELSIETSTNIASDISTGTGTGTLLDDPDPTVVEVACWVAGERTTHADQSVGPLTRIATSHDDPLCREAAVAALGALGHPDGLDAVLAGLDDKPAIRRRAVLALAAFEGPEVVDALEAALGDRDWQVRQGAEDLKHLAGRPGRETLPGYDN